MVYADCKAKINRYLEDNSHYPLIINCSNCHDFDKLLFYFKTMNSVDLVSIANYCKGDNNPQFDSMYNDMLSNTKNIVLADFFAALRLFGPETMRSEFKRIVNIAGQGKAIILTINSDAYLDFIDPKVKRRVVNVTNESSLDILPEIIFTNTDVTDMPSNEKFVVGIGKIFSELIDLKTKTVFVKTSKMKRDYPNSIYRIDDMKNAYRNLCHAFSIVEIMNMDFGSNEQWEELYNNCKSFDSIESYYSSKYSNYAHLENYIFNWQNFSEYEKWEFLLGLKMFGNTGNFCVEYAIRNATGIADFVQCIYRSISEEDADSANFDEKYNARKKLIALLGDTEAEAQNFCNYICYKKERAIYYLTDNTQIEKETVIKLLSLYGQEYGLSKIKGITKKVFPDLLNYLSDFDLKNEFLNDYFKQYKYQKVINHISDEFKEIVEKQSLDRDFYRIIQPRSTAYYSLNKDNSELVFFDALGVEYLAFIRSVCEKIGLNSFVSIYRCDLPSLTSINKDFVEEFRSAGLAVNDVKDLDEIKHKGKLDYDYNKVKEPIHLIKELQIIEDVLGKVKSKLINGNIQRVFIIADHGATRLAVINENTLKIQAYSKGEHGGRLCEITEDVNPSDYPQATVVDNKLILANYDMFAGAKRATVEVHGGATIEEITVPIIELSLKDRSMKYEFVIKTQRLMVNPNTPLVLEIYSLNKVRDVSIKLEESYYPAISEDYQNFRIELPKLSSGEYSFDVYSGSNLLQKGLSVEVVSGMSSTADFMDSFDF